MNKNRPIEWRLTVIMAERKMNNKKLAELTGMHSTTISKLRQNLPDRFDMDTLVSLCKALNCQPGDLMVYTGGDSK